MHAWLADWSRGRRRGRFLSFILLSSLRLGLWYGRLLDRRLEGIESALLTQTLGDASTTCCSVLFLVFSSWFFSVRLLYGLRMSRLFLVRDRFVVGCGLLLFFMSRRLHEREPPVFRDCGVP